MPTMNKTIARPRTIWDKIARAVRNDPKKAGILTVLVAILVVLQVRVQMSRDDSAARAGVAAAAGGAGTSQNLGQNRAGGSGSSVFSGRPQDAAAALRAWMEAAPAPLGRNLFAINLERFPQDGN